MNIDTPLPFDLPAVRRKKLTVDFNGGTQSSDAGLLLLREAERRLGVCRRLSAAMRDRGDPCRILHEMFDMVAARAMAIACGYKDAIDHDRLRHDALMKIAVGRHPQTGAPLASQSTITRLENAPSKTEAARLCAALVDQFGATCGRPRRPDLADATICRASPPFRKATGAVARTQADRPRAASCEMRDAVYVDCTDKLFAFVKPATPSRPTTKANER